VQRRKRAVVAVGGNSLILDASHESIPDQFEAAKITSRYIVDMVEEGWDIVVTHGNGPQVGFILRRSELAVNEVSPVPMDYAGADIQGAVGYMFQKALRNELKSRGHSSDVATVVTQTLVDRADPAFDDPSKPIGTYMTEQTARKLSSEQGWVVRDDAGRGWRRMVPSPAPARVVELEVIKTLNAAGILVICCGGGGIPVVEDADGSLHGVEAVIDKDLASSVLAADLCAELLVISTGVPKVALNFNTPEQLWLDSISLDQARAYFAQGHFLKGSMEPKMRGIISFLENGGARAIVTNPENLGRALRGETGSHFSR
jgi:carbamate kinase